MSVINLTHRQSEQKLSKRKRCFVIVIASSIRKFQSFSLLFHVLLYFSLYCSFSTPYSVQFPTYSHNFMSLCLTLLLMCKRYHESLRSEIMHCYLHGMFCIPRQRTIQNLYARCVYSFAISKMFVHALCNGFGSGA